MFVSGVRGREGVLGTWSLLRHFCRAAKWENTVQGTCYP